MPNLTDLLNEKYNVHGENIADALSQAAGIHTDNIADGILALASKTASPVLHSPQVTPLNFGNPNTTFNQEPNLDEEPEDY